MHAKLIKFIASLVATVVGAVLLVTGVPTVSNAEGVADYLYKCDPPDGTRAITISKGTPLTTCENAYILVYHNGRLIDRYETTNAGIKARKLLSDKQTVVCIVAVGSTFYGVLTGTGLAYKRIAATAWGAFSVKDACKA